MRDEPMALAENSAAEIRAALAETAILTGLGAELMEAEPGYLVLCCPAARATDQGRIGAGAMAALAEAAGRLAAGPGFETAEFSLHLHGDGAPGPAEKLIARAELLRPPGRGRPLATAQADVFRADASGAEALLATALLTLLWAP